MTEPLGEVFDLGYQHYQGPREGRRRARMALWVNGMRTALGVGRGSRAKILPVLLFVSAMAPAVIFTLIASRLGPSVNVPGHSGYYETVSIVLLLFSAIIAPELLCPDRREGVIHLYFVRPLTATDYVAGRWLAFFSITLALAYSGQIVLLVGFTLAAGEPLDYLRANWLDIPRFLAAGIVLAAFTTTLPMAMSAFTTRRAYAAALVIGLYFVSASVAGALTAVERSNTETLPPAQGVPGQSQPVADNKASWLSLLDIGQAPNRVNRLIFVEKADASAGSQTAEPAAELPAIVTIGSYLLLTAGPGFALWRRYQRIGS